MLNKISALRGGSVSAQDWNSLCIQKFLSWRWICGTTFSTLRGFEIVVAFFFEIPRLRVEWELQLPAYTTATAMQDPSRICDLHHSSWQCRILNPLSGARDKSSSSWILVGIIKCWAMTGTLQLPFYSLCPLLKVSCEVKTFLIFIKSNLSFFLLDAYAFGAMYKNYCIVQGHKDLYLLSSKCL